MPTKQQDDLLVDFDQQRKNKKSVVIRTYEKKKGIIKIKVRSKSVWFASAYFLACLQVCVMPKFLSLDFELPSKTLGLTLCFFKTGIKVQLNALAAGRRLIWAKNWNFHWGVRFLLVLRQLDVLGPFSGLLGICAASKKWLRGFFFKTLQTWVNAFEIER